MSNYYQPPYSHSPLHKNIFVHILGAGASTMSVTLFCSDTEAYVHCFSIHIFRTHQSCLGFSVLLKDTLNI